MARADRVRRLIVNADDFGASSDINQAISQAHERGILTSASLMVGGEAFAEAVQIARDFPRLAVGLHLTLVCGRSLLPPSELAGLVDQTGRFSADPVRVGWKYFKEPELLAPLQREVAAQLEMFRATGLELDHINGHLHMHLHPVILNAILALSDSTVPIRLTRDRFWLNARLQKGRWLDRAFHAAVFHLLARRAEALLRGTRRRFVPVVFGLLQNGRVDETYLSRLIPRLPRGDSELYSHPSLDKGKDELNALTSPRVRELVRDQEIHLIRYRDV